MKKTLLIILIMTMSLAVNVQAQHRVKRQVQPDTSQVVRNYIDSLKVLQSRLDSLQQLNSQLQQESTDGRFFRLFVPTTFYHSGANKQLSLHPQKGDEVTDAVDNALMHIYMRRPDLVRNDESRLRRVGSIREDVNTEIMPHVELTNMAQPLPDEPDPVPIQVMVRKPKFWKFTGDGYLQFLQNYVSDNWHKGGESNYSAQAAATLELNYNDRDKVTFENKLEMKLGFQTSPSDTVHRFKTNNDLLRLTSKLGIQAHKQWYYTLQMMTYTQFARGLKANDKKVYSDFTSPIDVNVGIGMEYKVDALNKRLTGTLNFLPFSLNFRYVARESLEAKNGIRGHHHTMEDFASQFTGELKWQIFDQLSWKTRLFAITTYRQSKMEWENQFQLKVTKNLSANLFVYPRFDDGNEDSPSHGNIKKHCPSAVLFLSEYVS